MRFLTFVCFTFVVAGCSIVSPVYQFYAHRHAVPMVFADYVDIPENSPQSNNVYDNQYQDASVEVLSKLENHRKEIASPGISAAVAIDGHLVWAGTSGWANIEENEPLSVTSQFRIGSTSKALNATLLAKMVDADLISLDTRLDKFETGRLNENWQNITLRHLASHMAGIPHYGSNTDTLGLYRTVALNKRYENVVDAVSIFDTSDTLFTPGEQFSYSSLGTVLLSAVMQDAAQQPYQQVMTNLVLNPLQLTHTMPEPEAGDYETKSPTLVQFYWHPKDKQSRVVKWREVDLSHRLAGGGYISTSTDLVKLGLGFMNPDFISENVRDAFWTPQKLNSDEVNHQNYAIGWRIREHDFGENIGRVLHANHGGVSRGAQSWLMAIPEYNMVVAVNINAKTDHFWDFGKISYELVTLFLTRRADIHTDSKDHVPHINGN